MRIAYINTHIKFFLIKILSNSLLMLIIKIIFIQCFFILYYSPILLMEGESGINSSESGRQKNEDLEVLVSTIEDGGRALKNIGLIGIPAAVVASQDDLPLAIGTAIVGATVEVAAKVARNEIKRKLSDSNNDIIPEDPPSPGFGTTYESSMIPDFSWIMEIFEGLDNNVKLIILAFILIICAFYFYNLIKIKNKINTKINTLGETINNPYLSFFIKLKNYFNKFTNIFLYVIFIICIVFAILIIIFIIWWF